MDFASLKKNRSSAFDKLTKQLDSMTSGTRTTDDTYWKLEVDKLGNGQATIRFLPSPPNEEDLALPVVKVMNHGFEGPGGWYIENSRKTLSWDEPDPASEMLDVLYKEAGKDEEHPSRKIAQQRKRRTNFHANIYVVRDPANPQNEGKVFKFKFGTKIFDKIKDAMKPQFEDEQAVNPFDMWEGADFKLRQQKVAGWPNYDKSEFARPGPMTGPNGEELDDSQLEEIWKQTHSLKALIAPSAFKSYDELSARLKKVLGETGGASRSRDRDEDPAPAPRTRTAEPEERRQAAPVVEPTSDDDDDLDFFRNLAKND